MKKNFTFSLDEKFGDVLKCLKSIDKRSINSELEVLIEAYIEFSYGLKISDFLNEYSCLL